MDGTRKATEEVAPLFYSQKQVALRMGISEPLVWKMVRLGRLPSITMGRRRLIPREAVERLGRVP